MKRTDENLEFIIRATKEITRTIYVRAKFDHKLTLKQCEQLRVLERARENAYCNLNQNKMRKFGKG
jgi:hypothetical protein